jgi:hypothetical protein
MLEALFYSTQHSTSLFAELDAMYTHMLKHSMKEVIEDKDNEELTTDFKRVIGSILILSEPLSAI